MPLSPPSIVLPHPACAIMLFSFASVFCLPGASYVYLYGSYFLPFVSDFGEPLRKFGTSVLPHKVCTEANIVGA